MSRDRPVVRSKVSMRPIHKKFKSYMALTIEREHILNAITHELMSKGLTPFGRVPTLTRPNTAHSTRIMTTL